MTLFLISFLIILVAMLAMAIGVMSGRRRIRGSCGGLGQAPGEEGCSICGGKSETPNLRISGDRHADTN